MRIKDAKKQRRTRIRKTIAMVSSRSRLNIHKSNKYCYAQVIDLKGNVLFGLSEKKLTAAKGETPIERAKRLGGEIAKMALEKKIKEVVFDRGGFAYHGKVKAIAEGAREGGLQL